MSDKKIEITVNGDKMNIGDELTTAGLLKELGYDLKRVAVEKNGEIVPKARYESEGFAMGDTVEIVGFVGGG